MTNIALVLGNGFDLDLGLRTRYADFADSKNEEWQYFINMAGTNINQLCPVEFVDHLQIARIFENWFDIEEEIFKFAQKHTTLRDGQIGLIRQQYEMLVNCLRFYLYRQVNSTYIKKDSLAYVLMNKLNDAQYPVSLYSFNYTDCVTLCGCKKREGLQAHAVHGTLFYNMILGCRVYNEIKENTQLDFLYKPIINLQKDILKQNLTQATETIIFGHSLNMMDYCYFKDFFDAIQSGQQTCTNLTIICKDAKSEEDIKRRLNKNVCLSKVEKHVVFSFIHTDLWNSKDSKTLMQFEDLCKRISS